MSWEDWRRVLSVNLDGAFLIAAAAFRHDARPVAAGRADHQQRLDLGACARATARLPYTASKHAITGLTKSISLDGRAFDIACGQIDIGNAASDMTAQMTGGVAAGRRPASRPSRASTSTTWRGRWCRWPTLPLDVNVQFITIMATKMPFVGRG